MKQGKLVWPGMARYPLVGVLIVVGVFWAATLWGTFLSGLVVVGLKFISLGLAALVVIPFGLRLPFGKVSFRQYADGIYLRLNGRLAQQAVLGAVTGGLLVLSLPAANLVIGGTTAAWGKIDLYRVLDSVVHGGWEEVLFRGVVLALCLRRFRSRRAGAAVAAVVFALLHLNLYHFIRLFFMALLWIVMTMETKSLFPAVVSHIVYDVFFSAFTPVVVGYQVIQWLVMWQTMVALVCLVGIYLTVLLTRRRGAVIVVQR
ncbi:MAG TPA: CPBP family intramembrane glutamic endopeptidase [Anaerolineales bacterium]|nr:CPBP family intramembrane glutamic endopeptidase [Anaerolineales bacterium]